MFKVNKMHKVEIYADTTSWFTKEEIEAMLDGRLGNGNVITIECPEWILRLWYICTEKNKYYKNFNEWLDNYVTDEVDGLYDFAKNLGWVFERR